MVRLFADAPEEKIVELVACDGVCVGVYARDATDFLLCFRCQDVVEVMLLAVASEDDLESAEDFRHFSHEFIEVIFQAIRLVLLVLDRSSCQNDRMREELVSDGDRWNELWTKMKRKGLI